MGPQRHIGKHLELLREDSGTGSRSLVHRHPSRGTLLHKPMRSWPRGTSIMCTNPATVRGGRDRQALGNTISKDPSGPGWSLRVPDRAGLRLTTLRLTLRSDGHKDKHGSARRTLAHADAGVAFAGNC